MESIKTVAIALAAFTALTNTSDAVSAGNHSYGDGQANIGQAGKSTQATRTVKIGMTDNMRFSPAQITAKQGETVRFVVTNRGRVKHELVLGSEKDLKDHAELMKKNPGMEHADDNMISLNAGTTGEIIWQFTNAGTVRFACLQAGHFDAGMKGSVKVLAGKAITATAKPAIVATAPTPVTAAATAPAAPETGKAAPAIVAVIPKLEMSTGEVRKIDRDAMKITLKHGEIKNLDMPGMTMVFRVSDPKFLDDIKVGDSVSFRADKIGGQITVTEITVPAK